MVDLTAASLRSCAVTVSTVSFSEAVWLPLLLEIQGWASLDAGGIKDLYIYRNTSCEFIYSLYTHFVSDSTSCCTTCCSLQLDIYMRVKHNAHQWLLVV